MAQQHEPLDPVTKLLCIMVALFLASLFVSERFFGSDGQIFQVIAGLINSFSGAFLMRVKPRGGPPLDPPDKPDDSTSPPDSKP